ncbi:MAG: hypothetical protein LBI64_00745, partial [Coriobacteriales bacterium]|nr:hypothetical protein [Coriobacteriales bacterium]
NDEFGEYYGQCPGPTVVKGIEALGIELDSVTEDTVGSSVGEKEFVASFFGVGSAAASLWRLGFLPSFDGTTYRLHSGKDGIVVYEITATEVLASSGSTGDDGTMNMGIVATAAGIAIVIIGAAIVLITKKKRQARRHE